MQPETHPETDEQLLRRAANALREPPTDASGSNELAAVFELAADHQAGAPIGGVVAGDVFTDRIIDLARAFATDVLDQPT